MEKTSDAQIIQKCINISCVEENQNNNSYEFGWKTKISNVKDNLLYNIIRFNSRFKVKEANVHLFNKKFNNLMLIDEVRFNRKLSKIVYVSYRSKYKPQINIRNNKIYTSDCGWGCMIRSSQMILCRALYKIFKYKLKQNQNLLQIVIPFIQDNNIFLFLIH